jgi:hypothetical protein
MINWINASTRMVYLISHTGSPSNKSRLTGVHWNRGRPSSGSAGVSRVSRLVGWKCGGYTESSQLGPVRNKLCPRVKKFRFALVMIILRVVDFDNRHRLFSSSCCRIDPRCLKSSRNKTGQTQRWTCGVTIQDISTSVPWGKQKNKEETRQTRIRRLEQAVALGCRETHKPCGCLRTSSSRNTTLAG